MGAREALSACVGQAERGSRIALGADRQQPTLHQSIDGGAERVGRQRRSSRDLLRVLRPTVDVCGGQLADVRFSVLYQSLFAAVAAAVLNKDSLDASLDLFAPTHEELDGPAGATLLMIATVLEHALVASGALNAPAEAIQTHARVLAESVLEVFGALVTATGTGTPEFLRLSGELSRVVSSLHDPRAAERLASDVATAAVRAGSGP